MRYDLVIRGGTVVDGTGGPARRADVGIAGDRIVEVGECAGEAAESFDATGKLVTPGFVDIHTHLDAQLAWDPVGTVSCWHGVTTAVMGNCGVTFAPCKPADRRAAGRDDGVGRGHPRRRHPDRPAVGLGELSRVPRQLRPHAQGHQRRRHGRALLGAHRGDGRAGDRPAPRRRLRHRGDVRARRGGAGGRRPRLLDVPHLPPPDAGRPGGARHLGRSRGAARHRRGHGAARQGRLRVRGRQRPPAPRAGRHEGPLGHGAGDRLDEGAVDPHRPSR